MGCGNEGCGDTGERWILWGWATAGAGFQPVRRGFVLDNPFRWKGVLWSEVKGMNFNDGTEQRDLNTSKTAADASADDGMEKDEETTSAEHLDHVAMDGAKRAQNRIHNDEQVTPGNTLFTK